MTFHHHYCNEPFRCWSCYVQFMQWAQARTNARPRRGQAHNFYAHVNVIAPVVKVHNDPG